MIAPSTQLEFDAGRNRVHARYRGHVTASDCAALAAELGGLAERVKPGFSMVVDFTDLEWMDLDCGPRLAEIMDACRDRGVGRIIRVIPDHRKDIGVNILSIIHYRGKVPTLVVESLAEADRALAR